MTRTPVTPFLRLALFLDAAVSGAMALLLVLAAAPLSTLLHLPEALLFNVGLVLVPYVLVVGWLGLRAEIPRAAAWTVIACNVVWAADSCWLLASGLVAPNAFGVAFVIVQAVAVLVFAELQFAALRRSRLAACGRLHPRVPCRHAMRYAERRGSMPGGESGPACLPHEYGLDLPGAIGAGGVRSAKTGDKAWQSSTSMARPARSMSNPTPPSCG